MIYHQCVGCELEWFREELEQKQQEIKRLEQERNKLIEGLRVYLADLAERHHEAMQKWDREADMYEQGAACAYDIAESMLRDILREIGVTVEPDRLHAARIKIAKARFSPERLVGESEAFGNDCPGGRCEY